MTTSHNNPGKNATQVNNQMLDGMGIKGDYRDACGPLVMDFVDIFVEPFMV